MDVESNITLIMLAGGTNRFAEPYGANSKVLLSINGRTLAARTATACMQACNFAQKIIVGFLPDDLPDKFEWSYLSDTKSMLSNLQAALAAIADKTNSILLTTADLPWLSAEAVSDFLHNAKKIIEDKDCDIVYPFNELTICTQRFPKLKRTSVRFKDLRVTGGNLCFAKNTEVLITLAAQLQPIIAARKNIFRLATCFGFEFVFKLIFGLLTIPEVCERASQLTGLKFFAYNSPYPEIGSDIDNERSYLYALRWFENHA